MIYGTLEDADAGKIKRDVRLIVRKMIETNFRPNTITPETVIISDNHHEADTNSVE